MGYGYGFGLGILFSLIPLVMAVWFVVFSVMVLKKLNKIIEILCKK